MKRPSTKTGKVWNVKDTKGAPTVMHAEFVRAMKGLAETEGRRVNLRSMGLWDPYDRLVGTKNQVIWHELTGYEKEA